MCARFCNLDTVHVPVGVFIIDSVAEKLSYTCFIELLLVYCCILYMFLLYIYIYLSLIHI